MAQPIETNSDQVAATPSCCGNCCFTFKHKDKEMPKKEPELDKQRRLSDVPFVGDLPTNLHSGHTITVVGTILPKCSRFSINLTCGKGPEADIALHLNPRLDQNYVVRNSRFNEHWGEEETTSSYRLNLLKDKFEITVFITEDAFMVAINGKHFCAYGYRVALNKLKGIEAHGLVSIEDVRFKESNIYPESIQTYSIPVSDRAKVEETLPNPCTARLPNGFPPGWQIEIFGKVKLLPHSFYVNLQQGSHLWPHPIIPLHLNPRFGITAGANSFVRNAWLNGSWGSEERAPGFQFRPGHSFHLVIRSEQEDYFSVWVDKQLTAEFKLRTGKNIGIDTVYIQGDIYIYQILVNDRIRSFHVDAEIA